MMNFILAVAFLCTFSWISVSVCQFNTVVVRPAEEVTLLCKNVRTFVLHIWWFKMNSSPNISRISSMMSSGTHACLHDGFNFSKYTVTSNTTNIFLKIKDVNFSDSGLYFCGENDEGGPKVFTATYLQVEEDGLPKLSCMILGCIAVFLTVVIIVLAVKIRTFQTGQTERMNPQPTENVDPDGLSYAALNFRYNVRSNRRSDERVPAANVLYAATR